MRLNQARKHAADGLYAAQHPALGLLGHARCSRRKAMSRFLYFFVSLAGWGC